MCQMARNLLMECDHLGLTPQAAVHDRDELWVLSGFETPLEGSEPRHAPLTEGAKLRAVKESETRAIGAPGGTQQVAKARPRCATERSLRSATESGRRSVGADPAIREGAALNVSWRCLG